MAPKPVAFNQRLRRIAISAFSRRLPAPPLFASLHAQKRARVGRLALPRSSPARNFLRTKPIAVGIQEVTSGFRLLAPRSQAFQKLIRASKLAPDRVPVI